MQALLNRKRQSIYYLVSRNLQNARYQVVMPYLIGDVLEIGCGTSPVAARLSPKQDYVGVDVNPRMIEWLARSFPTREFYIADVEKGNIKLGRRRFDTLLLVAVIEHFAAPVSVLRDLIGYVREGGQVVLTTPTPVGHRVHRLGARCGIFSSDAASEHFSVLDRAKLEFLFESVGLTLGTHRLFQFGMNQLAVVVKRGLAQPLKKAL
jgi:SAM-dependent methyltransferase